MLVLDADEVDRAEQTAGVGDRASEPGERARVVLEPDPDGGAERGRGMDRLDRLGAGIGGARHFTKTAAAAARGHPRAA